MGSILDTVSKDTEDTVIQLIHVSYLYLRYIFSQHSLMASVSKYLKDTEDTAFPIPVSTFQKYLPQPLLRSYFS